MVGEGGKGEVVVVVQMIKNTPCLSRVVPMMHPIMGAVSLWTRPPALYLCTGALKTLSHHLTVVHIPVSSLLFLLSSSAWAPTAKRTRKDTVALSREQSPPRASDEREGTPAATHVASGGCAACGSATSSRGAGRFPGSGGFGRRGASFVSPSTPSLGASTRCALWWRAVASSMATVIRS